MGFNGFLTFPTFTQVLCCPNGQAERSIKAEGVTQMESGKGTCPSGFTMPLHYPRYMKEDYEKMEEWMVDRVLRDYGLSFKGTLDEKRAFAMGAFLWPDQL